MVPNTLLQFTSLCTAVVNLHFFQTEHFKSLQGIFIWSLVKVCIRVGEGRGDAVQGIRMNILKTENNVSFNAIHRPRHEEI